MFRANLLRVFALAAVCTAIFKPSQLLFSFSMRLGPLFSGESVASVWASTFLPERNAGYPIV